MTQRRGGLGNPAVIAYVAVTAVQSAISFFRSRKGGQQRLTTTAYANEAERLLQANLAAFLAQPSSETRAVALNNFESVWQDLSSRCGDVQMGKPGQACIHDRERGGQFDWFAAYRDPIENAQVSSSSSLAAALGVSPVGAAGVSTLPWGLIGMAAALAFGAVLVDGGHR